MRCRTSNLTTELDLITKLVCSGAPPRAVLHWLQLGMGAAELPPAAAVYHMQSGRCPKGNSCNMAHSVSPGFLVQSMVYQLLHRVCSRAALSRVWRCLQYAGTVQMSSIILWVHVQPSDNKCSFTSCNRHSEQATLLLHHSQVFEYWLHPKRYRTQMCRDGPTCSRKVCFFAHSEEQLRHVPGTATDTADPFSRAKFSLSGMKRQKSCSTPQVSPVAGCRRHSSVEPAGSSSSIWPLFQPGHQAWDPAAAAAGGGGCYNMINNNLGSRRCSLDSHLYTNSFLQNSSIERASSSRKNSMDEITSGINGKSCYEQLVLGSCAADAASAAAGVHLPLPLHMRAPGSPISPQCRMTVPETPCNSAASAAAGTSANIGPQFRHWVPNGCTLPTATAAAVPTCLVSPGRPSHNAVDPNAYLKVLSVYHQQAENCRLQAALAEAAATAAAGKLQALVNALGLPDGSSSGIHVQPGSLECGLYSGLACGNLGLPGQQGSVPAVDAATGFGLAGLTATGPSLAVSGPGLTDLLCPGYQAIPGLADASLMLPGIASRDLLAAAAGVGSVGLSTEPCAGGVPLGQLQTTLLF